MESNSVRLSGSNWLNWEDEIVFDDKILKKIIREDCEISDISENLGGEFEPPFNRHFFWVFYMKQDVNDNNQYCLEITLDGYQNHLIKFREKKLESIL